MFGTTEKEGTGIFYTCFNKNYSNLVAALSYCLEFRRLEGWIWITIPVDVSTILGVRRPAPIGRHWANVLQSTGKHTLKGSLFYFLLAPRPAYSWASSSVGL